MLKRTGQVLITKLSYSVCSRDIWPNAKQAKHDETGQQTRPFQLRFHNRNRISKKSTNASTIQSDPVFDISSCWQRNKLKSMFTIHLCMWQILFSRLQSAQSIDIISMFVLWEWMDPMTLAMSYRSSYRRRLAFMAERTWFDAFHHAPCMCNLLTLVS